MKQLERLFDLSLDLLCIAGFDGHFKRVNPAFTRILGYSAAELLERPFLDLVHPEDREPSTEAMEQLMAGRPVIDFENRFVANDGSYRRLSWRASSVTEERSIYAVGRDVTESRRLERLTEATKVLRTVVEGTATATGRDYFSSLARHLAEALDVRYCVLSECLEDTSKRVRTLAFWNGEGFAENFEYDVAHTPCELVFAGETCVFGERVQEIFPLDRELRTLRAEGYVAVPMVGSTGRVLGLLAALDVVPFGKGAPDTSLLRIFADRAATELERQRAEQERQRLQAQVLHTQKLESLGILAGGIAHDVNNILVGILGNAGLAERELGPDSPARPFLERIEQAAERAADLANQMLAYSGKGHFVVETFQLESLVEEMANLVRTSISKKADLRFRSAGGLPPIRADATQIRQVVLNLVTNASDSIGDASGTIHLEIGALETDESSLEETWPGEELPADRCVFLKVSDTGCGMDRETRERIFDPFFTTKRTGRGLGMAAVIGIVRGHRGAIRVESEPGLGSAVTVLLPAGGGTPPSRLEPAEEKRPKPDHRKVLLVDDEETVRQVARRCLELEGYEVLVAADGCEALEIFLQEGDSVAAVVLDLTMPRMSGEETFAELRRLAPGLPVILTSGFSEQDAAARFQDEAPSGFLKKPYKLSELARKVESVLA